MSLSPETYRQAIGIASSDSASVLVYRDGLLGGRPSGYDAHRLNINGAGMLVNLTCYGAVFPPYGDDRTRREESLKLAAQVAAIRAYDNAVCALSELGIWHSMARPGMPDDQVEKSSAGRNDSLNLADQIAAIRAAVCILLSRD